MSVMAATEISRYCHARPQSVWIGYIIIGGIAGWLASKVVKGTGSGILLDIVVGVIGGISRRHLLLNCSASTLTAAGTGSPSSPRCGGAVVLLFVVRLARSASRR